MVFLMTDGSKPFLPTPSARRATRPGNVSAGIRRFLPTPSARRATPGGLLHEDAQSISTHALREEGDQYRRLSVYHRPISTHALREEGDAAGIAPRRLR